MICNTFFRLKTLFLDSKRSSLRHFGDGWKNHNICAWRTWLENVKRLLVACCLYNRVIPKKMIIRNWCRGLSRAAARVFDLCLTFYIYALRSPPKEINFPFGKVVKVVKRNRHFYWTMSTRGVGSYSPCFESKWVLGVGVFKYHLRPAKGACRLREC